jgi:uncharacterized protein YlaI
MIRGLAMNCPDCKGEMKIHTPSFVLLDATKKQLRGKKVNGYVCENCGLVRLYADKDQHEFEFSR